MKSLGNLEDDPARTSLLLGLLLLSVDSLRFMKSKGLLRELASGVGVRLVDAIAVEASLLAFGVVLKFSFGTVFVLGRFEDDFRIPRPRLLCEVGK